MFAHKKNQMKTPKYVHFGSTLLYVENQEHQDDDNELEKIYKDDLSDGIASMAKEQIDAWKLEMEENKMAEQSKEATKNDSSNDTNEIDENFLKELSELCSKCLAIKSGNSRSIEDWLSRCKNISPMTNKTLPASFTKATPNHALRQEHILKITNIVRLCQF